MFVYNLKLSHKEPLKSFDFNKRNDRDSIDTLELLKGIIIIKKVLD